jgi:hypothetical protein
MTSCFTHHFLTNTLHYLWLEIWSYHFILAFINFIVNILVLNNFSNDKRKSNHKFFKHLQKFLKKQLLNQWTFHVAKRSWEHICWSCSSNHFQNLSLTRYREDNFASGILDYFQITSTIFVLFLSCTFALGTLSLLHTLPHVLPP